MYYMNSAPLVCIGIEPPRKSPNHLIQSEMFAAEKYKKYGDLSKVFYYQLIEDLPGIYAIRKVFFDYFVSLTFYRTGDNLKLNTSPLSASSDSFLEKY